MGTKTVTGQQILDAIIQNGWEHNQTGWWEYEMPLDNDAPLVIRGACVMGQAALNLGVSEIGILGNTDDVGDTAQYPDLNRIAWKMIDYNDLGTPSGRKRTYTELVALAKRRFQPILDKTFELETAEYITTKGKIGG